MSKRIAVVIAGDPCLTHQPVEALRIALGLCSGDHDATVVLLGNAARLLTDQVDDVVDVDILEKYRPSFQQLGVRFILEEGAVLEAVLPGFTTSTRSHREIRSLMHTADRTLVFQ
jgi:sulfur relay (sulfurtransferase) DsrF/TusC family protein